MVSNSGTFGPHLPCPIVEFTAFQDVTEKVLLLFFNKTIYQHTILWVFLQVSLQVSLQVGWKPFRASGAGRVVFSSRMEGPSLKPPLSHVVSRLDDREIAQMQHVC